ncbi:MAG: hypothetical protein V1792_02770 [Pseudomonadota bacterium]
MEKALSLHVADPARMDRVGSKSGNINESLGQAEANGRLGSISGLVHSMPTAEPLSDQTDDLMRRRDQIVRRVLKRLEQVLKPPVPPEVERYIRTRDRSDWLPWEQEVIAKVGRWRSQLEKIGPELVEELSQAVRAIRNC